MGSRNPAMVHYLDDLRSVEAQHGAYANEGAAAASLVIRRGAGTLSPTLARVHRHV